MNNKIVLVGAGETALLAYEYFTVDTDYEVVCFAVDRELIQSDMLFGLPVVALDELHFRFSPDNYRVFVAMSSGRLNRNRQAVFSRIKEMGYSFVSYISSRAFVWRNVLIGENCFILENNVLQPFTTIGNNVTLWSGNHVGHRTVIRDHCFISSHCVISGYCDIGESSFLGVNCTLEDHVKISSDNFIGAGALIQKDTGINKLYQEQETAVSKVNTHRLFRIKE
jgi:sugar O-acyltransferase (sialic acid O-acetyltransferase NeuD family)